MAWGPNARAASAAARKAKSAASPRGVAEAAYRKKFGVSANATINHSLSGHKGPFKGNGKYEPVNPALLKSMNAHDRGIITAHENTIKKSLSKPVTGKRPGSAIPMMGDNTPSNMAKDMSAVRGHTGPPGQMRKFGTKRSKMPKKGK